LLPYAKYLVDTVVVGGLRRIARPIESHAMAGPSSKVPPGLRFAYEHTLRALDRYATVLSELRTRTSIVLTATGIVVSTLGASALEDAHPLLPLVCGLVALTAGLAACIAVLWAIGDHGPNRHWKVTISNERVRELATREDESDLLRSVVDELTEARRLSYTTLNRRTTYFQMACWLLGVQILAWAAVILF
jgi:hypothetical protein